MDFLFVSAFACDPNTGAAGSLIAMGRALCDRGHKVEYLWEPERRISRVHPSLARLFDLPRRQYRQVANHLRYHRYDVVIVSQPYAFLVYERLTQLYPHTLFLNRTHGWEDRVYQSNEELRWDPAPTAFSGLLRGLSAIVMKWFCTRTAKACHGVITPARGCAEFIQRAYDIPPDKVSTIGYGLSEEYLRFEFSQKDPGRNRMLFVGQYLPRKGIRVLEDHLPEVARKYPDAELTFIVQEDAVDRVLNTYRSAFGERLTVYPWMDRAHLIDIYRRHDIFLYPSLFEGFGKAVLEAMACGMCVVGFNEGGLSDIAAPGVEALYCKSGNNAKFRQLLDHSLDNSASSREIGRSARIVAQQFTWARTAEETESFCRRLGDILAIRSCETHSNKLKQDLGPLVADSEKANAPDRN